MKKSIVRTGLIILLLLLVGASAWVAIEFRLNLERKLKGTLQQELSSTRNELDKVRIELGNTRKQLNEVNNKLAAAESNNARLLEVKNTLEAKLHSLKELKTAIRQVKKELWQERYRQLVAEKEIQKEIDANKLSKGNRGFVLKDGKSTYKPLVKIEVRPAY